MAYRKFADADGVAWQVWDVKPTWLERRRGRERRTAEPDSMGSDPTVGERRAADRRRALADSADRLQLSPEFDDGWLCFEALGERRRLAPRPQDWHAVSDEVLEVLCRQAEPSPLGRITIE